MLFDVFLFVLDCIVLTVDWLRDRGNNGSLVRSLSPEERERLSREVDALIERSRRRS